MILLSGPQAGSFFPSQKVIVSFFDGDSSRVEYLEAGNFRRPLFTRDTVVLKKEDDKPWRITGVLRNKDFSKTGHYFYSWLGDFEFRRLYFHNSILAIIGADEQGQSTGLEFYFYESNYDSVITVSPIFQPADTAFYFEGKLGNMEILYPEENMIFTRI